jgi:hypothetical protein
MARVTIRIIELGAQEAYKREQERYAERVNNISPGQPWPMDMRYPEPPKPMIDSLDPGLKALTQNPSNSPCGIGGQGDPRPADKVDLDGNMQDKVKGYESKWDSDRPADSSPFKLQE